MVTSYRHPSRDSAKEEAQRLALKHPGQHFFVAAVTGAAVLPVREVVWTELKSPDCG